MFTEGRDDAEGPTGRNWGRTEYILLVIYPSTTPFFPLQKHNHSIQDQSKVPKLHLTFYTIPKGHLRPSRQDVFQSP